MDTCALVDPSLLPLLSVWPTGSLSAETLADVRTHGMPAREFDPAGVSVTGHHISGQAGGAALDLLIYRPDQLRSSGCIFYTHGGGFVIGSAKGSEPRLLPMARELGCVVVSIDYALAPEAVFPTQIDQCYAGLAWVFEHAAQLGIDDRKIGVMGDSAGGGLTAALALMARDRGEFALAFQHLFYPMLDDRTCIRPHNPLTGQFIWTPASNSFGWRSLLGRDPGGEGISPYAAPARAADLAGLPPTYLMCGALDLFLEEDLAFAKRLLAAGVQTELHIYPGAYHGFNFLPDVPVSDRANRDSLEALRRALP